VFTPARWARWALDRLDIPARTAGGESFCDPSAGEGAFALALAEAWAEGNGAFDPAWARRITLIDREGAFLEAFARSWHQRWGFAFPEAHLIETDVVTRPPDRQFPLVAGNPPWVTYPDLPPADQDLYRPWFSQTGLVGKAADLLLGRSRLDLAALVTARVWEVLAAPGAATGFFLPMSLFHNEGAPGLWRRRAVPRALFDLTDCRPFPGVSVRCGWAEFGGQPGPAAYFTGGPDRWHEHRAVQDDAEGPWRLAEVGAEDLPVLDLAAWQRPRQGVNTGGLNAAFHVTEPPAAVDPAYVHPLAGKPGRWILVPYDRQGRLIDEGEVERSGLGRYWAPWKEKLAGRRGIFLGAQLTRGRWWALLGVGPYAFAPYKVIWSAYGKHSLDAQVYGPLDGSVWQADQALQAYIPCANDQDAQRVARFLNGPATAAYLEGLRAGGTRNWAQPGRISRLLRLEPGPGTRAGSTGN